MAYLPKHGDVDDHHLAAGFKEFGIGVTVEPLTLEPVQKRAGSSVDTQFRELSVEQIQPFDAGPRLLRNPKWTEIKASIKASGGLTNALSVTRRPGSDRYICHQGGNTRLLVLKELFDETLDPRFGRVRVDTMAYTSDFDIALLHDRENTCRGDLTFIEDAWSKYRLYQMYCGMSSGKTTARAFVDYLSDEHGADLTVESFSRIKYTVEVLHQHIPTCLIHGGMSLRAVRRLITLRNGLKKAWTTRSIGTVAHFDETFYGLLVRQDKDLAHSFVRDDSAADQFPDQRIAVDWTEFQQDLQHEISVYAGVSYQKAAAWIAAAFRRIANSTDVPSAPNTFESTPSEQGSPDVNDLRTAACAGARRIAAAGDLEDLIRPSDDGFGYQVAGQVPETASPQSKACWWALVLATSPADEVARYAGTAVGAPSFAGLPAEVLSSISALFAHHARIVRTET